MLYPIPCHTASDGVSRLQVWLVADLTPPTLSVCTKIRKFFNYLRTTAPAINYTWCYRLALYYYFQPFYPFKMFNIQSRNWNIMCQGSSPN